jgi:hypothetical protein
LLRAVFTFSDCAGGAGALLDRVAVIAAGVGVHSRHGLEIGGEGQRALRLAGGDHLVFDGLAHHFQDTLQPNPIMPENAREAVRLASIKKEAKALPKTSGYQNN